MNNPLEDIKLNFEKEICEECKADNPHERIKCGKETALINPYRVEFLMTLAYKAGLQKAIEVMNEEVFLMRKKISNHSKSHDSEEILKNKIVILLDVMFSLSQEPLTSGLH